MNSTQRLASSLPTEATPESGGTLRGRRYGEDRIHLLVRDPRCVFATWEVGPETVRGAAARATSMGAPIGYQLRIDRREREESPELLVRTVDLPDALAGEGWYVDLPQAGGWCRARIGLDLPGGFVTLLTSRWAAVPPDAPCAEEGDWALASEAMRSLSRYFSGAASVPGSARGTR